MLHTPRAAIVGTGFVGSSTAYALLMSGFTAEIVLIDRDRRRAEGHANDLRVAEVFSHNTRVLAGEFGDCCSADVTIITTGVSQAGLKSRLDGMKETADIVHGLVRDVAKHNHRGILLIASNPVDVLTYAAWKWSGQASAQPSHRFRHSTRHGAFPSRRVRQSASHRAERAAHCPLCRQYFNETCTVLLCE